MLVTALRLEELLFISPRSAPTRATHTLVGSRRHCVCAAQARGTGSAAPVVLPLYQPFVLTLLLLLLLLLPLLCAVRGWISPR